MPGGARNESQRLKDTEAMSRILRRGPQQQNQQNQQQQQQQQNDGHVDAFSHGRGNERRAPGSVFRPRRLKSLESYQDYMKRAHKEEKFRMSLLHDHDRAHAYLKKLDAKAQRSVKHVEREKLVQLGQATPLDEFCFAVGVRKEVVRQLADEHFNGLKLPQSNSPVFRELAIMAAKTVGVTVRFHEARGSRMSAVDFDYESVEHLAKSEVESADEATYATFPTRPAVVCVMGHVDHGKTTLLDALRSSQVAAREAGGITQSIGAFFVKLPGTEDAHATFLDTPGHAAFKSMRARGADVTDIIVLVVGADDSVQPQTIEAINLAKAEDLPLVVAVNKCDRGGANPQRVREDLASHGVVAEDMGGDVPVVNISALTGKGLEDLADAVALTSDMLELRAPTDNVRPKAMVVEAHTAKQGTSVNVVVLEGVLRVGQHFVCGMQYGVIRALYNDRGEEVSEARPGHPVRIAGLQSLVDIDDDLAVVDNEEAAEAAVELRRRKRDDTSAFDGDTVRQLSEKWADNHKAVSKHAMAERDGVDVDLDDAGSNVDRESESQLHKRWIDLKRAGRWMEAHDVKMLLRTMRQERRGPEIQARKQEEDDPTVAKVIVKADVKGSLQAILDYIEQLPQTEASMKVLGADVGALRESDLIRAESSRADIVCFNLTPSKAILERCAQVGIQVHSYDVIYSLFDKLSQLLADRLPKKREETTLGEAKVRQVFMLNGRTRRCPKLQAAGCLVRKGKLVRNKPMRVLRDGEVVYEKRLSCSLRLFKDEVAELEKGQECGVLIDDFTDFREGDVIVSYEFKRVKQGVDDKRARGFRTKQEMYAESAQAAIEQEQRKEREELEQLERELAALETNDSADGGKK
eukprot:TRINITY_DN66257_c9_g6_i1.p1 TRINITY_DN66257_c9_g6~~TRINITY_DN66257_c9_g6_i1.p1  ORF type:complete len:938 (+),score=530.19 TRINITY_DN66257_c9_g6_i1:227-2815(+)